MRSETTAAALALCVSALLLGAAPGRTQGSTPPAMRTDEGSTAGTPQPGSNSFTEGQARSRMEDAGFRDVSDLHKDDQGIWRGRATRNGSPGGVALDFQGNVFGGTTAATPAVAGRDVPPGNPPGTAGGRVADRAVGTDATGANLAGGRPDGGPGNPPSTAAAGRTVERAQDQTPQAGGTPGNPSSTAAGRVVDRALGTNTTGANPGAGNAPSR